MPQSRLAKATILSSTFYEKTIYLLSQRISALSLSSSR
uniref:Uncharacterized protein n=1 Tax=Anguilla anguilla TaxID=7936 RepID=A0A0E9Q849_ANGAN